MTDLKNISPSEKLAIIKSLLQEADIENELKELYAQERPPNLNEETINEVQLVTFSLGKESFGVNILSVQEIITVPEITRIPNSPSFIEGVINLRGKLVPVIDLRKKLNVGLERLEQQTRILVIKVNGKVSGFLVDAVEAVMNVPEDTVEVAPEIVTAGIDSQYITGVSKLDDRMIILLNFNKLLSKNEMASLNNIRESL